MNTTHNALPARLKKARKDSGLTQDELAKAATLSQPYIAQIERGDKMPSVETLKGIGHALGVSVSWLLGQGIGEGGGDYPASAPQGPLRELLADYSTPEGLRDLASDRALIANLRITDGEWNALRSIDLPGLADKDGYVALLFTIRTISR